MEANAFEYLRIFCRPGPEPMRSRKGENILREVIRGKRRESRDLVDA